nr:hypothetical protein [Tanacetum cinerariifolium]
MLSSVHDDVGVPNEVADDNAKDTSVCDDINEVDAAADDNAKAMSVCDDIDQADVATYDNAKEVVLRLDNGEVVKETQLPDSHEDVFQPCALKRMKKETLLSDCPPVIGNYLKEIHIEHWEENLTKDSNAPKTRIHVLKEVLDYLNQTKKPRHCIPWRNGLNVN